MVVVFAVSIGVLAGCSSGSTTTDSGAAPVESSAAAASARTPDRALSEYLLKASDVPTGYSQMTIPANQMTSLTDSFLASSKTGTVTPANCKPDVSGISAESVKDTSVAAFSNGSTGDLIVSLAVPNTTYIDTYRRYNLGSCAQHSVTTSIEGQTVNGTVSTKELDIKVSGVDDALVVQQDTASQIPGGASLKSSSLTAFLPVNGVTVTVSKKKVFGAEAPDVAGFKTVVAAAAKRATG